jgi:uncharacterized membrane protein YcaP (DUF421 family)
MDALELFQQALGLKIPPQDLTPWQVAARSLVVFVAALVMVRLGAKRFLARKTAFDLVLAFILGSMLSRAINGSAPFLATLLGAFVLVGFHRFLAAVAFHSHAFGSLIKGTDDVVIDRGEVCPRAMRKNHLSEHDLLEELRLQSCNSPDEVRCARLERSGELSVIKAN